MTVYDWYSGRLAGEAFDRLIREPGPAAQNGHRPARSGGSRRVMLTPASMIRPRPVRWLWEDRVPIGEITMTPGRGGIGKSTFHAWLISRITTGTLPGTHMGAPRPCLVATSEDSWECTVVPRLIVAGADLDLVYRVDVELIEGGSTSLSLPVDCDGLEAEIIETDAALLSVDPLMSTISAQLDTHKDRDVRQALEPLHRLAERTRCVVLGNAHFNKGMGSDVMALLTGSAAFGNVARSVLAFVLDPDDEEGACVISQIKNNLGRTDLPSLRYVLREATLDTDEGPARLGRLVMLGESDRSVEDVLRSKVNPDEMRAAAAFLRSFIPDGGWVRAADVIEAAEEESIPKRTLQYNREKLGYLTEREGFGKGSTVWWGHPKASLRPPIGAIDDTGATTLAPETVAPIPTDATDPGAKPAAPMPPMAPMQVPLDGEDGLRLFDADDQPSDDSRGMWR